jgi:hypothetical protein
MSTWRRNSRNWSKDPSKFVIGGLTLVLCLILHRDALGLPQIESNSTHLQKGAKTCRSWINSQNLIRLEDYRHHGQMHAYLVEITGVLLTDQIDENQFPYSSEQRRPVSLDSQTLFNLLSEIPQVDQLSISSTLIGSPEKDARKGIVRLGFLQDRRPVVVKTLVSTTEEDKRMNEARGAMLLSAIGVGPHFHGIAREGGNFHLITDLIVGKSYNTFAGPTIEILRQFETIIHRFTEIHLNHLPEHEILFQAILTNTDQILAIDAEGYYEVFLDGNPRLREQTREGSSDDDLEPPWDKGPQSPLAPKSSWVTPWYRLLAMAILTAEYETATQFMAELKYNHRLLYKSVIVESKATITKWNPVMARHLKDYFLNLEEPK